MRDNKFVEHAAQLLAGSVKLVFELLQLAADHIEGTPATALYFLRTELVKIARKGCLGNVDSLIKQQLRKLHLAGDTGAIQNFQDLGLARIARGRRRCHR